MFGNGMGFSDWGHGMGGMMSGPFGMILMILFWLLIVMLIVKLFQSLFSSKKDDTVPRGVEAPLDVLKRRYAAGEITKAEFDLMKKDIS